MIQHGNGNRISPVAGRNTNRQEPLVHAGMKAGNHHDATVLTLAGGTLYRKIVVREDRS